MNKEAKLNPQQETFLLSQQFCQSCLLASSVPAESAEILFVMVLDILSAYIKIVSNLAKSLSNEMTSELANQKEAVTLCIEKCPEDQKQVLMKKYQNLNLPGTH